MQTFNNYIEYAEVAELVDTHDSGSFKLSLKKH